MSPFIGPPCHCECYYNCLFKEVEREYITGSIACNRLKLLSYQQCLDRTPSSTISNHVTALTRLILSHRGGTAGGGSRVESRRRRLWEDGRSPEEEANLQQDPARAHEAQQAVRAGPGAAQRWQHGYMTHFSSLGKIDATF